MNNTPSLALACSLLLSGSLAAAQTPLPPPPLPPPDPVLGIRAEAELGFVTTLSHFIQLGRDGARIDYRDDGGQTNLYTFARASIDVDVRRRHHVTFLYQPLQIDSSATLGRDLRIDGATFAAGTPVRFRYGFPFFRAGWAYDVLPDRDRELAFGVGLQLRNASIEFESVDGRSYRQRNDVGPVPLLRARGRFPIGERGFFGFELDGIYAPISVLNGSDNEVTGAILDASVRVGWRVIPHVEGFVNLRYLGGGAVGQGDPTNTSDGYQSNWLHFMSVSLGFALDSRT
jgi:hypothetical protein